jgi:hypothetical protein
MWNSPSEHRHPDGYLAGRRSALVWRIRHVFDIAPQNFLDFYVAVHYLPIRAIHRVAKA